MIRNFPEVKNRLKQFAKRYNDDWKQYKIRALRGVDFFNNVPETILEELQYKLQINNYEVGAKIFTRSEICDNIYFIVSGGLELYIE